MQGPASYTSKPLSTRHQSCTPPPGSPWSRAACACMRPQASPAPRCGRHHRVPALLCAARWVAARGCHTAAHTLKQSQTHACRMCKMQCATHDGTGVRLPRRQLGAVVAMHTHAICHEHVSHCVRMALQSAKCSLQKCLQKVQPRSVGPRRDSAHAALIHSGHCARGGPGAHLHMLPLCNLRVRL